MYFLDIFHKEIENFQEFFKTTVIGMIINQLTFDFLQSLVEYDLKQSARYGDGWFEGINLYIDGTVENGCFKMVTTDEK